MILIPSEIGEWVVFYSTMTRRVVGYSIRMVVDCSSSRLMCKAMSYLNRTKSRVGEAMKVSEVTGKKMIIPR